MLLYLQERNKQPAFVLFSRILATLNLRLLLCRIGIATDSIKQKRSKAIDMRFHWVRDRVRQGQFIISYIKSADNVADYFTKTLDPVKHKFFMQFLAPLGNKIVAEGVLN
jgi:hypothetical protein